MSKVKRLLLTGAVLLVISQLAAAPKIGTVDLERIFKEYYKSRIAEDAIRRQSDTYRKYMLQLNSQLQNLLAEERVAKLNAQNIALDAAEQKKAVEAAETAIRRVREKRAEIELYGRSRTDALRGMETRKRQEVMTDILAEVRRRATAEGYDFVFDRSGRTMNDQPALLVSPAKADFTDSVIRELNRTATKAAPVPTPIPGGPKEAPVQPRPADAPAIVAQPE